MTGLDDDHRRKRPAVGDGISAGSASPLPRDSQSPPPPHRSRARPASTSNPDTRQSALGFDEIQRPRVEKGSLWTADQEAPTRTNFENSNVASHQIQKSRNQLLQKPPKKQIHQSSRQNQSTSRQSGNQSSPTVAVPSTVMGRSQPLNSINQVEDEPSFDIVLQPETRPISQEQLVAEVKGSK
jgi:hypothetical protein